MRGGGTPPPLGPDFGGAGIMGRDPSKISGKVAQPRQLGSAGARQAGRREKFGLWQVRQARVKSSARPVRQVRVIMCVDPKMGSASPTRGDVPSSMRHRGLGGRRRPVGPWWGPDGALVGSMVGPWWGPGGALVGPWWGSGGTL
eukprot:gene20206-biopygen4066